MINRFYTLTTKWPLEARPQQNNSEKSKESFPRIESSTTFAFSCFWCSPEQLPLLLFVHHLCVCMSAKAIVDHARFYNMGHVEQSSFRQQNGATQLLREELSPCQYSSMAASNCVMVRTSKRTTRQSLSLHQHQHQYQHSLSLSIRLSISLSVYHLSIHPSIPLSIHPSIDRSNLPIHPSIYLSIYRSTYLPTYRPTDLPTYLPTFLSFFLSFLPSFFLSLCLSVSLSLCLAAT